MYVFLMQKRVTKYLCTSIGIRYKNKKIKIHRSQIHGKSALKNMDSQGDDKTPLHKI